MDYIFGTIDDIKWLDNNQEKTMRNEIDEYLNTMDNMELKIINELIKSYQTVKKDI